MIDTQEIQDEIRGAISAEQAAIDALKKHSGPVIAVINQSTVVSDDDVRDTTAALQIQLSRDFVPAWGLDGTLVFYKKGEQIPAGAWQLVVLDNSPQADALGFHDLTSDGLPIGKVFAKTDLDSGSSWTVTASHELLEMRADPDICRCVLIDSGRLYALEVGDAPEDDQFGYQIDGVLVSDFVYPSWFESFWKPGQVQFDYGKHINAPFEILTGGYIGYMDIRSSTGWQQLTHQSVPNKKARAPIGSRRERRRTPKNQWQRSTI